MRIIIELVLRVFRGLWFPAELLAQHSAWECLCGHRECRWCGIVDWDHVHAEVYRGALMEFDRLYNELPTGFNWESFHAEAFRKAGEEFDRLFDELSVTSNVTYMDTNAPKARCIVVRRKNGRFARTVNVPLTNLQDIHQLYAVYDEKRCA